MNATRTLFLLIAACVTIGFMTPSYSNEIDNDITGRWEGTIDSGQSKLRIVVEIERNATGSLTASLISVDQGGIRLPISTIEIAGRSIHLEVSVVGANYAGALNGDMTRISGKWSQGIELPLELVRAAAN